jgi:hypothetical protein
MANEPKITFHAAAWSDHVAADLRLIDGTEDREITAFAMRIADGDFHLLEVRNSGERIGSVIWSIEREFDRHVVVINAACVRPISGACITAEINKRMEFVARTVGAKALRCWTQRAGLVRKLETLGAKRRYVMELEIV